MRSFRTCHGLMTILASIAVGGACLAFPALLSAPETGQEPEEGLEAESFELDPESAFPDEAAVLSPDEQEALLSELLAAEDELAAQVDNNPPIPPEVPEVPLQHSPDAILSSGAELTDESEMETEPPDPFSFVDEAKKLKVGRNFRNPLAQRAPALSLAEPSAANDGKEVFYTGNTHAEVSTDGGRTYTGAPVPQFPGTTAPFPVGDLDVIHDHARGLTFWSVLYVDKKPAFTKGVVRVFVRRTIAVGNACSYTFAPKAEPGKSILPDYPHLGLSNNFLYLTTLDFSTGAGGKWIRSELIRLNIDEMGDCKRVSGRRLSFADDVGQRAFVPVEGARRIMYFGILRSRRQFEVFGWPETSPKETRFKFPIMPSTFGAVNCTGGRNMTNWVGNPNAANITGRRLRGAVGNGLVYFYWNVAPDAIPQLHVHGVVLREPPHPGILPVAEPTIQNSKFCFGYPAVSINQRGDVGISIAAGSSNPGTAGGDTGAVQGSVNVSDDFSAGIGLFRPQKFRLTAIGSRNPAPGANGNVRFGDYFSVHPHEPCTLWFSATNYALDEGTDVAHVNARYVEFGRGRDEKCYFGWRNKVRE